MVPLQVAVLILATFARPSRAVYCICKDDASQQAMQNDIDYACASGADCSVISPGGPCFEPNTVKDHCNFAVNSYFQRQGKATGSCDFRGSATTSDVVPPSQVAGCVYEGSAGSSTGTPLSPVGSGATPLPPVGSGTTPLPPVGSGTTPLPPTGTDTTPPFASDTPPSGSFSSSTSMTLKGALSVFFLIVAGILG